ncbi:MAG: hypothetical protein AB9833_04565 [Bacteroidales bacterium]
MSSDKKTNRVFELAEQFEFRELLNIDKKYILSVVTEEEYNDLRNTIHSLPNYFMRDIEPITNIPPIDYKHKKNIFTKFILYPLQFYKVAAIIIIAYFLFNINQHNNENLNSELLTQNDTVFINKKDTITQIIHDTVWVAETKNIIPRINRSETVINQTKYNEYDLSPDNVEKIMNMTNNNSLANDSILKSILVLLN